MSCRTRPKNGWSSSVPWNGDGTFRSCGHPEKPFLLVLFFGRHQDIRNAFFTLHRIVATSYLTEVNFVLFFGVCFWQPQGSGCNLIFYRRFLALVHCS